MHRARRGVFSLRRQTDRMIAAVLVAVALASVTGVVVYAMDGPYNTNPPYCRSSAPYDPLWWWYQCMYPDDPSWGKES